MFRNFTPINQLKSKLPKAVCFLIDLSVTLPLKNIVERPLGVPF
jgi:hypothetical protein